MLTTSGGPFFDLVHLLILNFVICCFWDLMHAIQNLGRYFKQSSKAMEQKVSKEARFYGSLIRYVPILWQKHFQILEEYLTQFSIK